MRLPIPTVSPAVLLSLALATACAPDLPDPVARAGTGSGGGGPEVWLELEPASEPIAAPAVLRAHVHVPAGAATTPEDVVLVEGEVGVAHLRQLEDGDLSKAFSERLLPAVVWAAGGGADAAAGERRLVVAPTAPLTPGKTFTIASGHPRFALEITVADPAPPYLERVWPPEGLAASADAGVWCGPEILPASGPIAVSLAPTDAPAILQRGVAPEAGLSCLRLVAGAELEGGEPLIPPAGVTIDGVWLGLDPRPLQRDGEPVSAPSLPCEGDEVAFGPGCARVLDDRILGRTPEVPQLWAVHGPGIDEVFETGAGDPFSILGLPPSTLLALEVVTMDTAGVAASMSLVVETAAPMPHLVLNEVMANPLGPEPHQEWIEIVNDGLVAGSLAGHLLRDVGGDTILPDAVLEPGEHALLVNEAFVEDDEVDPPPAPGTLLVRVGELGTNGLTNAGEPLQLVAPDGGALSRFLPLPHPKAARTAIRRFPGAPDGLGSSFEADVPPTPGRANL
jgi:hypothetical protein